MVRFGEVTALDGADLTVPEGAVTAVIGPSGCGKSTLLRVVAGLQIPDAGRVTWRGADLAGIPTHRRGFGLMFQDFALFPHRSVAGNVGFGLRMAGWDARRAADRIAEVLGLVGLDGYGNRPVEGLSGGEQQRVALARTLAPEPALVMLDEPVASLDRALRERLVDDMRRIFTTLGITVVYVTHDQGEAFAVADRMAVMHAGRVVRHGEPGAVWSDPRSELVARFLGHEAVLTVTVTGGGTSIGAIPLALDLPDGEHRIVVPGNAVAVGPVMGPGAAPGARAGKGLLVRTTYRGGGHRIVVDVGDGVHLDADVVDPPPPPGSAVEVRIDPARIIVVDG